MSPVSAWGSRASGRSGITVSASRMACTRSTPTAVCAMDSHRRQILNRLEELREIGKKNRQCTCRHSPRKNQRGAPPQHDGDAKRNGDGHNRREQCFHAPRLERRVDCRPTTAPNSSCARSCRPKAFTTRIDSRPCSTTATMLLCCRRTSCVAFFTAFLNRDTNKQQKRA